MKENTHQYWPAIIIAIALLSGGCLDGAPGTLVDLTQSNAAPAQPESTSIEPLPHLVGATIPVTRPVGAAPEDSSVTEEIAANPGDFVEGRCTGVHVGSVRLQTPDDVAAISMACEITGDLVVDNSHLLALALPALKRIGGSLHVVHNKDLTWLSLPALDTVGGRIIINFNEVMTRWWMPALAEAGDGLLVNYNVSLSEFEVPSLVLIGGTGGFQASSNLALESFSAPVLTNAPGLVINNNPALTDFALPALETAGNARISSNPHLEGVWLPALTATTDLQILANGSLVTLSLPTLETVHGSLTLGDNNSLKTFYIMSLSTVGSLLIIEGNASLAGFALPNLNKTAPFIVKNNASLKSFCVPYLETVGHLGVEDNPVLNHFPFTSLKAIGGGGAMIRNNPSLTILQTGQLTTVNGSMQIVGNDGLERVYFNQLEKVGSGTWGGLMVRDNPELWLLSAPALGQIGVNLSVTNNPALPQCMVDAMVDGLDDGWHRFANSEDNLADCICTQTGNHISATCEPIANETDP